MGNESSDDQDGDDLNKSYIYEDESRRAQIMPPNNNKINEFWSSDEGEDKGNTPSGNEDEAMGDTSSNGEGKEDIDRPSDEEDESRLTRVKPPNNILGSDDYCKRRPSLQLKENCEINDESDNYWDAEEEINESEKPLPQNGEVKKAYEDKNNALSENFIGLEDAITIPSNALINESNVSNASQLKSFHNMVKYKQDQTCTKLFKLAKC